MTSFLDKLRGKSENERRIVALIVAGIVVSILFVVWVTTAFTNFAAIVGEEEVQSATINETSAFDSIGRQFGSIFDAGMETFDSFGEPVEYEREGESNSE